MIILGKCAGHFRQTLFSLQNVWGNLVTLVLQVSAKVSNIFFSMEFLRIANYDNNMKSQNDHTVGTFPKIR